MRLTIKILIYSALSLFFVLNANEIFAQEIYYNDDNGSLSMTSDGLVRTSSRRVTLSWEVSKSFAAPYIVTVRNGEGRLDSIETPVASYVVDAEALGNGSVSIMSIGSCRKADIDINYNGMIPLKKTMMIVVVAICGGFMLAMYRRERKKRKSAEREKEEIASPTRKTQKYDNVTVLFSDIQGFTKIAEHMNPEQLVDELDKYFIYFDELVDKYDVEKIKTIGDAYMCAGGVPQEDSANPIEVALVGLGMIAYVKERQAAAGGFWNIRVGLNTGPVVSGTLGNKKKIFDIWGDSVNTASRMESGGVPGEVNVSGDTYAKIADYFECEHRGKMPVKYKGEIDMYFVKRLKAEYCEVGAHNTPNKLLLNKIKSMKVEDLLNDFEKRLNAATGENTFTDRFEKLRVNCEMICREEQMSDKELMMSKIALMSTFGAVECPKGMKTDAAMLSNRMKKMHFDESEIEEMARINNRMMQGKKAETHIEEAVYDSFAMLYGRKNIAMILKEAYNCAVIANRHFSKKEWIKNQQHILTNLSYYTNSARELAEVPVTQQKEIMEQIIRQF